MSLSSIAKGKILNSTLYRDVKYNGIHITQCIRHVYANKDMIKTYERKESIGPVLSHSLVPFDTLLLFCETTTQGGEGAVRRSIACMGCKGNPMANAIHSAFTCYVYVCVCACVCL